MIDFSVRLLFVLLMAVAFATDQFHWSWIWITPIVLASVLNMILAAKTPMHRPLDVLLAGLLISPEIYLWVKLITFTQVWLGKLSAHKKDGWANQYKAESGKTSSKLIQGLLISIIFVMIVTFLCFQFRDYLTSSAVQTAIHPYLMIGWISLTYLTIFSSLAMLYQIWTLRGRHSA